MTASRVRLVSVVWLLALLVIVLATWAGMTDPRAGTTWEEVVRVIALGFGFTTVGAILVTRRPREPVGRIALLIGLVAIAATGLRSVAIVLDWAPGPIPSVGVALSTLIVAALFQPIRRRVQAPIDRRFNRGHLDAERVVGSLAKRARDEVDLARLREAVVGVMVEAVRPVGAAIWLRPEHPIVVHSIAVEGTRP